MPAAAYKELIGKGEGIAGYVIATGWSLFIEEINHSEFARLARRASEPGKSVISSPFTISGHIVRLLNWFCRSNSASDAYFVRSV